MLNGKNATATVAVKELQRAKTFYEGTLGLQRSGGEEGGVMYKSGSSEILVYESQYAGTNKATAVTWVVGAEVDAIVRGLKAKGVKFEHYDLPQMKHEGDIHVAGTLRVAWFKDPDGNIHSLANR